MDKDQNKNANFAASSQVDENIDLTSPEAESTQAAVSHKPISFETEIYKVGLARQIVLWLMFIMFLPFFMSMPAMIFMRATHGNVVDASALGAVFFLSILGMGFIVLQILTMGRMRVELYDDRMDLTVPTWRGPTPFGPIVEQQIPYASISKIEQRGGLYAFWGILGLHKASSVITADGQRYVLGYVAENDSDAPIPLQQVVTSLADRSQKPLEDKGSVNAGTQVGAILLGAPSWDKEPLEVKDVDKVRKRAHRLALLSLVGFFVLLFSVISLTFYPEIMAYFNPQS